METGATLDELIEAVQLESGHSTRANVGLNMRDHIAARIRREYKRLHAEFDWPHLLDWATTAADPGEHDITPPTGVELAQLTAIWVRVPGDRWRKLDRSLGVEDYNIVDTDAGERRSPATKWRAKGDGVEIWPSPELTTQIRWVRKSKALPLAEPDDVCDIDTDTVVLFTAATLLFKAEQPEAGITLQRGRNRFETVRQRLQTGANKAKL